MNRRESLSRLLLTSGALVTLPAWANEWEPVQVPGPSQVFSENESLMLKWTADAIIPQGNSIGALSVGVDTFLLGLLSQCYDEATQNSVKVLLTTLDAQSNERFGVSFITCDPANRKLLVGDALESDDKALADAMRLVKSETIRGFTTSREVMTKYLNYKVIPGHYYGCVPVKS